ncbi:MAG: hypothetical protein GTN36_04910 [Candidatus Aenigmarchaeota archaeon]|nr:hypothetical protein [Candidatus Aenigmarchaeota archaeon]
MAKKDVIKKRYLLVIFIVSFIVSFILFNVSASAKMDKRTKVYIFPKRTSYPKLEIGDLFETNVKIDDVNNLYGYEFKLGYDPEVLEFVGIGSSFLDNGFKIKKTDETSGIVKYAVGSLYPAEPKNGDGTLATITFKVISIGGSVLDIYDTKLLDSSINRIDHAIKDGYFSNEDDEIEVETEWEEKIETNEFSTEQSSSGSIVKTNMMSLGTIYTESSGCTDNDLDSYDGFHATNCPSGPDCNDNDPMIYPANGEMCDKKDNNCNGHIDEPDVCLSGDIDHQTSSDYYEVGLEDLMILGQSYGSRKGESRYDDICINITNGWYCDLNDDGIVNIFDLAKIGKNYGKTTLAGCVNINVEFESGTRLPYADVYVNNPSQFFGTTNSNGQVTRCCFLDPGDYFVNADYNNEQFGSDTSLSVIGNGSGNTTIIGNCVHLIVHVQESINDPIYQAPVKIWDNDAVPDPLDTGLTNPSGDFKTNVCLIEDIFYTARAWRPDFTPEEGVMVTFNVPEKPIITIEIPPI